MEFPVSETSAEPSSVHTVQAAEADVVSAYVEQFFAEEDDEEVQLDQLGEEAGRWESSFGTSAVIRCQETCLQL